MKEAERILCLINIILESPDSFKKAIFKFCEKELIKFIGQVALNLLKENIVLSDYYKSRLAANSGIIRSIGSRRVKERFRRKLCVQNHDVVTLLLKACYDDILIQLE
jgi:hypothetical protein